MQPQGGRGGQPRRPDPHWTDRRARRHLTHEARGPTPIEFRRERTLAEWYGEALAPAEIAARRSGARPVAEILDEALQRIGLADARLLEQVRELWPSLVGADVARRAVPAAFRNRVLTVQVSSGAWLYVLEREHRVRVRDRLRDATDGAVDDVRFVPPGRTAHSAT